MSQVAVMHITDTLDGGGMERVAVNISNLLPRERYRAYLCTTRRDGVFGELVAPHVGRLRLERHRRLDGGALRRLLTFIRENNIRLLHAHDTSLFVAAIASLFPPYPSLIWHDHFGLYPTRERSGRLFGLVRSRISGVIAVNEPLAEWSRRKLRLQRDRIWYVPNFVSETCHSDVANSLPGESGERIVSVANIRPHKDLLTLLRAMFWVVKQRPKAHLLIVGPSNDQAYFQLVNDEIVSQGLSEKVTLLGQRLDVPAILQACDVGVVSSTSEGLPLSLLEYGMVGLPAIATRVGQCAEVLDEGAAGIVVESSAPNQLADAILLLLGSPELRALMGQTLKARVKREYSETAVMGRICDIYECVLESGDEYARG